jgi:DNA-binding NarL/FixJ family response regulator
MTLGPPRILIVDDHASVRDGLRAFLENKTNFTVCGEADDGVTAIEQTKALKPDLIIMDLVLPRMNGIEASSVLKSTFPGVKIVAFSMYADELGRAVAAASRIDAVLPKSSGLAVLAETIRRLLNMPPPLVNPSGGSPQSCSPA